MIRVHTFTFNPFEENTYVLYDETREAVIIDPGCFEKEEQDELVEFIAAKKLKVKILLNTHCHIDHVLGNYFVKEKYKVPFLIHTTEGPVLRAVKSYASNYGFPGYTEALPDGELKEGTKDKIMIHFRGIMCGYMLKLNEEKEKLNQEKDRYIELLTKYKEGY